jgi:hypothetical protein
LLKPLGHSRGKQIAQLVARCVVDYRIPEFHNKDIGLSQENVELVKFMLRFQRSVLPVARTTNATKCATASYDRRGALDWINAAMLEHLQHQLRWDVQEVQNAMQSASSHNRMCKSASSRHKKLLSRTVLKMPQIARRHAWPSLELSISRASSVARVIHETPNTRSRSKSLPLDLLPGMGGFDIWADT